MLTWIVVLWVIAAVTADPCNVMLKDGTEVEFNDYDPVELAVFPKTIEDGSIVLEISSTTLKFESISDILYFQEDGLNSQNLVVKVISLATWDVDHRNTTDGTYSFVISVAKVAECDSVISRDKYDVKASFTIQDVNMAEPKFSEPEYNIVATFPLNSGFSLTSIFNTIIKTTDTDFSTSKIMYKSSDPNFEVLALEPNGKEFPLSLNATKYINFQTTQTVIITAVDSLDPPKESSVKVNILVDKTHSQPPTPQFKYPTYTANINIEEGMQGSELGVEVSLEEPYDDLDVTLLGGLDDLLKLERSQESIKLVFLRDLTDEDVGTQVFSLAASIMYPAGSSTSYASLVLIIEGSEITTTPTQPTETDPTETEPTESQPTETEPTESQPTETDPTVTSTTETDPNGTLPTETEPTDAPPTVPPGTTKPPSEQPTEDPDEDDNSGLIAATAILAVTTAGFGGFALYLYLKYVRGSIGNTWVKDNPIKTMTPHTTDIPSVDVSTTERGNSFTTTMDQNGKLKVETEEKTRKRSMTFSENDERARIIRESDDKTQFTDSASDQTDSRSGSTLSEQNSKEKDDQEQNKEFRL